MVMVEETGPKPSAAKHQQKTGSSIANIQDNMSYLEPTCWRFLCNKIIHKCPPQWVWTLCPPVSREIC
jgi:hypothetical protein